MKFKALAGIVATVLALSTSIAKAEIRTYEFKGTVTYGGNMALAGTPIQGNFSIDTKSPSSRPKIRGYEYASYQMPADLTISAKVGLHTVVASNLSVTVFNDMGGNTEDMIDVAGAPVVVDGTNFADGAFGFRLASGPGSTRVLNNTQLPREFEVSKFDAGPTLNYGFIQSSGQEGGVLLNFSIESIEITQIKQ